jgi:hypothetical protein
MTSQPENLIQMKFPWEWKKKIHFLKSVITKGLIVGKNYIKSFLLSLVKSGNLDMSYPVKCAS